MAEDIETKIRRLRELGKVSAEPGVPGPEAPKPVASPKKPPRKPRSLSSIRQRERRKRILVGAAVLITIILLVSVGVYAYLQSAKEKELQNAKATKLAELNNLLNSYNFTDSECRKKAITYLIEAKSKIESATSVQEVESVNVKMYFDSAVSEYQNCVNEKERIAYEAELNQTKLQKIQGIRMAFQPLLSLNLPDSLQSKAIATMKSLEEKVQNAKTIEEVESINVESYLLSLWRDYYFWKIDNMPGNEVVVQKGDFKQLVSKEEAKVLFESISNYTELLQYRVSKVEYVEIALTLPREQITGGFLQPGDKVSIFVTNSTNQNVRTYREVVNIAYVEFVLLPVDAGDIDARESQSEMSSTDSSSSITYDEDHSFSYDLGGSPFSNSTSASDTYSNSQSVSQSSSASYAYRVDLSEILKAIAAGKIQADDEVRAQLESYGWRLVTLEQSSNMLVLSPDTEFLVIIRVPSVFVPDILQNPSGVYIAKIS